MPIAQLWPYVPLVDVRETWSWRTDLLRLDQLEQRTSFSDGWMALEYEHYFQGSAREAARSLFRNNDSQEWTVPVWTDLAPCAVAPDGLSVTVTSDTDFGIVGDALCLFDGANVEAQEITDITGQTITVSDPFTILTNAQAMPAVQAIERNGFSARRVTDNVSFASLSFVTPQPLNQPATTYPQYLTHDILDEAVIVTQPLEEQVILPTVYVDAGGFGPVVPQRIRQLIDETYVADYLQKSLFDLTRRRRWLQSLRGRDRPFWYQSGGRDLEAAGDYTSGASFVAIKPVEADVSAYQGRHIYIDGEPREIITANVAGSEHRLSILPIPRPITNPRISYLNLVRLNADSITIEHVRSGLSRLRLPLIEVPA